MINEGNMKAYFDKNSYILSKKRLNQPKRFKRNEFQPKEIYEN